MGLHEFTSSTLPLVCHGAASNMDIAALFILMSLQVNSKILLMAGVVASACLLTQAGCPMTHALRTIKYATERLSTDPSFRALELQPIGSVEACIHCS